MAVVALHHGGAEVEAALGLDVQLLDGAAAEFADLNGLLQLVHDVGAVLAGRQNRLADVLGLGDAADVQGLLHLRLVHAPGGEAYAHLVEHAHLTGYLLAGVVGDGIDDYLVAIEAAEAHGSGRMAVETAQGGVQFRHRAAVAVNVQELDALGRVLVGEDGHQHRREGVEAAHLAGIEVFALLALGLEGGLEGAVGVHGVGAEHGHVGVEHRHRRAEARDHRGVLVVAYLRQVQHLELDDLTRGLQALEHPQPLRQRPAAACAQEGRPVKDLDYVLFVQLSHVRSSLIIYRLYYWFPRLLTEPFYCCQPTPPSFCL